MSWVALCGAKGTASPYRTVDFVTTSFTVHALSLSFSPLRGGVLVPRAATGEMYRLDRDGSAFRIGVVGEG